MVKVLKDFVASWLNNIDRVSHHRPTFSRGDVPESYVLELK